MASTVVNSSILSKKISPKQRKAVDTKSHQTSYPAQQTKQTKHTYLDNRTVFWKTGSYNWKTGSYNWTGEKCKTQLSSMNPPHNPIKIQRHLFASQCIPLHMHPSAGCYLIIIASRPSNCICWLQTGCLRLFFEARCVELGVVDGR